MDHLQGSDPNPLEGSNQSRFGGTRARLGGGLPSFNHKRKRTETLLDNKSEGNIWMTSKHLEDVNELFYNHFPAAGPGFVLNAVQQIGIRNWTPDTC